MIDEQKERERFEARFTDAKVLTHIDGKPTGSPVVCRRNESTGLMSPDIFLDKAFVGWLACAREKEAEIERLRGITPEMPPLPPHWNGPEYQIEGIQRYGIRWNGPESPLAVPMDDGYWVPFHIAHKRIATLQAELAKARSGEPVALDDEANRPFHAALAHRAEYAEEKGWKNEAAMFRAAERALNPSWKWCGRDCIGSHPPAPAPSAPTIHEVAQAVGNRLAAQFSNPRNTPMRTPHEVRECLRQNFPQWEQAAPKPEAN